MKTVLTVLGIMILALVVIHVIIAAVYAFYIGCAAAVIVLGIMAYRWLKKNL